MTSAQGEHAFAKALALHRIDHGDVARVAERGGEHVTAVAPALAGGTVLLDLIEQRAEPAQLGAHDTGLLVDDDAGDLLPPATTNDPHLVGMHREAFGGDHAANEAEHGADIDRAILARQREVIGVARVGQAVRAGVAGDPVVEPAAHHVRDRRAGRRTLR